VRRFFGDEGGDELHMAFSFTVNQAMYLALAREQAAPLAEAIARLPELPPDCQWASFVRNHDELTLDKLSQAEREEVFAAFGPAEEHQLYGRGLRRRLPTMLGGDERRIRMVYSLMFSLPGTPVLLYGEEIGMPENLELEGRMAVRTPIEWSDVEAQRRDADSLLNWFERIIRRRRDCPELGWGRFRHLSTRAPGVFAHRCDWDGSAIVAVHNLAGHDVGVTLPLDDAERLVDLLGTDDLEAPFELALGPYDFRWYRATCPSRR
jgi:glycosidase